MEELNCPRCNQCLNQTSHRLIKENCGHHKCRQCLIKEDNGCDECIAENLKKSDKDFMFESESVDLLSNKCEIDEDSAGSRLEIDTDIDSSIGDYDNELTVPKLGPQQPDDKSAELSTSSPQTKTRKCKFIAPPHLMTHVMPSSSQVSYECKICKRKFRSKNMRMYHVYCDETKTKPHQCDTCGKRFVTKSHMKQHEEIHSTASHPFQCSKCDKSYIHKTDLKMHQAFHEQSYKFKCKHCDRKFLSKRKRDYHEDCHEALKPYKCKNCDKSFSIKGNLMKHQIVHTGAKNFRCDICKKNFPRKASLKSHMLSHKSRMFQCKDCSKEFVDSKSLERHLRIHFEAKEFSCSVCGLTSSRKDNLLRHVRNFHPETTINNGIIRTKNIEQEKVINTAIEKGNKNLKDLEKQVKVPVESNRISVIQSVGTAKPVKLLYKHNKSNKLSNIEINAETVKHPSTPPAKFKEYDPIEIYRKILQPSNEDDTSSTANDESSHVDFFQSETNKEEKPLNFSEIHWRKRNSLNFHRK